MSSSPYHPLGPAHFSSDQSEQQASFRRPKRVGVFFATREGHTKRIAKHIATGLRTAGFDVDLIDVRHTIPYSLLKYSAAILAASVHAGNHEAEMIRFVQDHRTELDSMMTAFLSVTLSEAGAERQDASPVEHVKFAIDVESMLNKFYEQTNWRPTIAKPVAGALLYSKYNFLIRFIMKRIAKKEGAATDTSQDYDYTDWLGLDQFVDELTGEIRCTPKTRVPSNDGLKVETLPGASSHA
jgi:menaquinone-dependent protoporphyrinogen oxidase